MAEVLTPQQQAAVFDRGGTLLVSAAAGSGKTKVLVDRLLSYIMDSRDPANLDDFLIITYTKAAASELRGKIASKLSEKIAENPSNRHLQQQIQRLYLTKISTVHAFCSEVLREYAYQLDISSDFRMAEETECQQLQAKILENILDDAYANIGNDPDLQAFVDTQGLGRDDRQVPEIVLKVYNSARCHMDPEKWLNWCTDATDVSQFKDLGDTPWGSYLIEDLSSCIKLHLQAMEQCRRDLICLEGMEKVLALVESDIAILNELLNCKSWDEIHGFQGLAWNRFPGKCSDKALADKVKAIRNACKEDMKKKLSYFADADEKIIADLKESAAAARGLVGIVSRFSAQYEKAKNNKRILDFSDLEHRMLDLLYGKSRSGYTVAAREIGNRFREVMVDEYQDSNAVQDAIFAALTYQKNNCFMVGDVKQSIYQFRLADPTIFLDKYNAFKSAADASKGQPRKVILTNNFRSSGQVVHAVNDVFGFCMSETVGGLTYGEEEMLYEGIAHAPQSEPEVELHCIQINEDTYAEEATFVAQRICQLLDGTHTIRCDNGFRPIKPEDIVILLRSPGSVGGEFCAALQDAGIRCAMPGGDDLLQTEEVGTLCAILRTISNPLQDIYLAAALSSRVFCFTADELASIRAENRYSSFYNSLLKSDNGKVKEFLSVLSDLRRQAKMCSITQLIGYIFEKTGLDSIFAAMDDGKQRNANLQAFCQFAVAVEATGKKDLVQFLAQLEILSETGLTAGVEQASAGAVTIMSIHKSKGLEFPVVFLCGLSRRFNHQSAHEQVLCHKDLGLGLSCVDSQLRVRYPSVAKKAIALKTISEGISEEMRVLYVAMTRARDRLIMTYASAHLENTLSDIANRIDYSDRLLMTQDVDCPGKWILQTAICRTEAGQLHSIGGHPDRTNVSDVPWLISVVQGSDELTYMQSDEVSGEQTISHEIVSQIQKHLSFRYSHFLATTAPSKQTATYMKGRHKDKEVNELTVAYLPNQSKFRKPSFIAPSDDATTYGKAVHAVMEHIDFERCGNIASIEAELKRLTECGYISEKMASLIPEEQLYAFFAGSLGQKLINSEHVLREFKFSILDDADRYMDDLQGEQVLLQGVIDCAVIEDDGITVIDFKTDKVNEKTVEEAVLKYTQQIKVYASALTRIYKKPIKASYLYFFHINQYFSI